MKKENLAKKRAKVVVLVGLPASGKSYYARSLSDKGGGYIINQDTLGTRRRCLERAKAFLNRKESIIIDRCNTTILQRSYWIQLAEQYDAQLECVVFDPHVDLCYINAVKRKNHPNFPTDPTEIEKIIRRFNAEYQAPTKDEGFKSITHYHSYHLLDLGYTYRE